MIFNSRLFSRAVITNPPAFPGTRPRKATLQPIVHPTDILTQFREDWMIHTHWTSTFIHVAMRNIAGLPSHEDLSAVNDFYRTNRFDISSHYNRSIDSTEPTNITSVDQITNPVGRLLVTLLDQHISLAGAVGVVTLDKAGIFSNKEKPASIVKSLGLIESEADYAGFDPVAGEFINGEKIVRLLANVYQATSTPNEVTGTILDMKNDIAFQAFNKAVGEDPYFKALAPEVEKMLTEGGIPLSGSATNIWSTHLLQAVITANTEAAYIKASLPRTKGFLFFRRKEYGVPTFEQGYDQRHADNHLQLHTFHMAALFAFSVGVKPSSNTTTPFK